jgi:hypothetical protein
MIEDSDEDIGRKKQGLINLEIFLMLYNIRNGPVAAELKTHSQMLVMSSIDYRCCG